MLGVLGEFSFFSFLVQNSEFWLQIQNSVGMVQMEFLKGLRSATRCLRTLVHRDALLQTFGSGEFFIFSEFPSVFETILGVFSSFLAAKFRKIINLLNLTQKISYFARFSGEKSIFSVV